MTDNTENNIRPDMKNGIHHTFYTLQDRLGEDMPDYHLYKSGCFEIDLIVEGGGVHCIDGKAIPCKGNDIYVVSPNVPHRYFVTEADEKMVIRKLSFCLKEQFEQNDYYGVFNDGSNVAYAMLNSGMREKISTIMDSIECELMDEEKEWETIVTTYLIQLFAFIGRYISNSIKNIQVKSKDDETVCEAIKIIDAEFDDCELSLGTISERLYVSSSRLCRSFKAYTGKLFSEYLREVRLKHSTSLLENSDLSVKKIVAKCGFVDMSAFYRNFREAFGMTPQIYRQLSIMSAKNTETKTNNESEQKKMEMLNEISINLQHGKHKVVKELVQQAIDEGVSPAKILDKGLLSGMNVIGEKFKNNEIYVPEVLVAARAMNMGAQVLKPHLASAGVQAKGRVCIGTVKGDLHDIGKNLVKMMMEGKGLEVIDLGTDVTPETFVSTAIEKDCQVICCSALLTTTMSVMQEVVKLAESKGIRDKVKIMVGGAPVNEEFCKKIGADCYTNDAASAADKAVEFCK